ncbi:hypothetical protein DFQ27_004272 [Actinomortierella ambigua]|uniref:Uncharacterized protein n=1 Tax=Actinomortierella ambigua TaxID=1343610 RepID=A0A9P6UDH3_9FUNG|nr:hypothetical protein DFQ27_004272 [Actinomortierella ambigua]
MSSIIASAPAPATFHASSPCIHNPTAPTSEDLSWQPSHASTGPASFAASIANSKYRTLASMNAASSIPSTTTTTTTTTRATNLYSNLTNSSPKAAFFGHASQHPQLLQSAAAITAAIQEMDKSHGTCFLTWIHNPANLDYVSLRLRPLCLQYPLVAVANVLRWIGADWSSQNCKALFRSVTHGWDQTRRRMLAYLLIKDEEMRQKAKTKLIEFVKKNEAKNQLRLQQQQQQQQEQQQQQHHQQVVGGGVPVVKVAAVNAPTPTESAMRPLDTAVTPATTPTAKSFWTDLFEGSAQLPLTKDSVSSVAAASIITGLDILDLPAATTATRAPISPVKSVSSAPSTPAQQRFSPYGATMSRRAQMAQSLLASGQATHRHMPILPRNSNSNNNNNSSINAAVLISAPAVPAAVETQAPITTTTAPTTTTPIAVGDRNM